MVKRILMLCIGLQAATAHAASSLPLVGQPLPVGTTLAVQPATTSAASINIPPGSAPSSPVNGDVWTNVNGVYVRTNGVTYGPQFGPIDYIGTSLVPSYLAPYAGLTGTTTASSATLTVSAGDAAKFHNGDAITVSTCSSCSTVMAGGGTTSITMDAAASTSSSSASVNVGSARYDANSSLLVNALGTNELLIGAAAQGYGDWSGVYSKTTKYSQIAQLKAVSSYGGTSGFFAARTSDMLSSGGLKQMENVIHLAVLDTLPSTIIGGGWNMYQQATLASAAQPSTTALGFQQEESSIENHWTSPKLDPYQTNVTAYTENLRLDCGVGSGSVTDCSTALHIITNGALYKTGIIFGDASLNTSATQNNIGEAIAMPYNYGISWYTSGGNTSWQLISSTSANVATINQIRLYTSEAQFGPNSVVAVTGPSGGTNKYFSVETAGSPRWSVGGSSTSESGSNAGTDFAVGRFSDAGAYLGTAIFVQRSTGNVGVNQTAPSSNLDVGGTMYASTSVSSPIITLAPRTYSALPTCNSGTAGTLAFISDASIAITTWHQAVTAGGGANKAFIACNGSGWYAFDY